MIYTKKSVADMIRKYENELALSFNTRIASTDNFLIQACIGYEKAIISQILALEDGIQPTLDLDQLSENIRSHSARLVYDRFNSWDDKMMSDYASKSEQGAVTDASYYKCNGREAIELIDILPFGFDLGNAIKYLWRAGLKPNTPAKDDANKAIYYLQRKPIECTPIAGNSDVLRKAESIVYEAFGNIDNLKRDILLAIIGLKTGNRVKRIPQKELLTNIIDDITKLYLA